MSGILNPEVLVLGAGGTVGFGVVGALLEADSPVLGSCPRRSAHAGAGRTLRR